MFQDLDTTLAELLTRELPQTLVQQTSISFATPGSSFPPPSVTLPAVNLFLYEIQENRDLRSYEPWVNRQVDGRAVAYAAPTRVDCHYLVTAWVAQTGAPNPEQDEHRILGEVMRVLLRYRELPAEVLRGEMTRQATPLRAGVLLPSQQQTRGDFWQALGGKPKAAFNYTVTISIQSQAPADVGSVVAAVETS